MPQSLIANTVNRAASGSKPLRIRAITTFATVTLSLACLPVSAATAEPESASAKAEFDKLDQDHDGRLSRAEAVADKMIPSEKFLKADRDRDGTLDLVEYESVKTDPAQKKKSNRPPATPTLLLP